MTIQVCSLKVFNYIITAVPKTFSICLAECLVVNSSKGLSPRDKTIGFLNQFRKPMQHQRYYRKYDNPE